MIGIIRRCARCKDWRSIDAFDAAGRLCRRCTTAQHGPKGVYIGIANGYRGRPRGMAITDKGRAFIRESAAA